MSEPAPLLDRPRLAPRHLAQLIDLYERNYLLLVRLIPDLDDLPYAQALSRSQSDCPLHLQVSARDRYTLTLRLSYEFVDEQGLRRQPDLWLRVYQDAGVVEALQCEQRPPWRALDERDPAARHYLSAQWRRNVLLHKWLQYLLESGHGFGMSARPRLLQNTVFEEKSDVVCPGKQPAHGG
ncbi:DUF1249 domain-containing protein [Sinimarinibacterium sp. NLF-5-8]|uniref:DUF1249 domain-containing protein n=1 Tax=Sinimarinibacterium sp. NLF-5-8 TaxID=2698684 RepID=UPI00137BDBDD|nr:DUF1249 domain-containing protein [Sinimarinibacterium sp. NLF-5-8]QHS09565.1 DUF1249 domain-containing protein [Sinimarinibacterium sp. NLF-5-8]